MLIYLSVLLFLGTLISWIFLVIKYSKKKTLSSEKVILFTKLLKRNMHQVSPKAKLIDYDKLYHKILNELGYWGSFWEALKLEPKEVTNIDKIWKLHKLRNKLVHDFDDYEERHLRRQASEYEKEIKKLLKWTSK